jgi:hypothetical protein
MEKPDFEKMARAAFRGKRDYWQELCPSERKQILALAEAAYSAGLERAAEISEARAGEWAVIVRHPIQVAAAIRAEKPQ